MNVARFNADQRTKYGVPHTITCVLLGVSVSWFYEWITRVDPPDGLHSRADVAGRRSFRGSSIFRWRGRVLPRLSGSGTAAASSRDAGLWRSKRVPACGWFTPAFGMSQRLSGALLGDH